MRIGVGVCTTPDARQAAVEAAGQARDELAGEAPSLAVLLGSRAHTDRAADVLSAVLQMIDPPALVGCIAQAIVAGRHEIEDEPAVVVWLASGLAAETFQLDFVRTGSGALITGYRFDRTARDLHLLLPDPYTFPSNLLIEHPNTDLPGTAVVGGVVSGGRRRATPGCSAITTCSPPASSACACPGCAVSRSCRRVAGRSATHTSSPARTAY
ncbi:hypothetical protein RN09_1072 [Mycobacterium tuberculosis variant africanum]|nr:hypothetical protein RN09_1072 [Mycobacterium tuberculosis variant africanum]